MHARLCAARIRLAARAISRSGKYARAPFYMIHQMTTNLSDHIRIILVEPENPINVGNVMRAIKNMGFSQLYLVHPAEMDLQKTQISAHRSTDILENIHICDTLDEALAGVHESYGFSARMRSETWASLDMESAVGRAIAISQRDQQVAYVFGRERTGLTNDELMRCTCRVHIETSTYSSLNLAQAVLLAVYATFRQSKAPANAQQTVAKIDNHLPTSAPATMDAQKRLIDRIESMLVDISYFKSQAPGSAMHRIQNILMRAELHDDEIQLLMGICAEVTNYARLIERGIRPPKIKADGSIREN